MSGTTTTFVKPVALRVKSPALSIVAESESPAPFLERENSHPIPFSLSPTSVDKKFTETKIETDKKLLNIASEMLQYNLFRRRHIKEVFTDFVKLQIELAKEVLCLD